MDHWIRVCAFDEIPRQGARVVARRGQSAIAVFRAADDRVFALVDRCPHRGGPLSQGIVHGHRVACPLHGWSIELASGAAVAPDVGCARTLRIEQREGGVYLHRDDVGVDAGAMTACAHG